MAAPWTEALGLLSDTLAACAEWQEWCAVSSAGAAAAYIHTDGIITDTEMATLPRCRVTTEDHSCGDGIASGTFKLIFLDHTTGTLATDVANVIERIGQIIVELREVSRSGAADYLAIRGAPRLDGKWSLAERAEESKYRTIRQAIVVEWGLEREG